MSQIQRKNEGGNEGERPPQLNPTTNLPAMNEQAAIERLSATQSPVFVTPEAPAAPTPIVAPVPIPAWMYAIAALLLLSLVVLAVAAVRR